MNRALPIAIGALVAASSASAQIDRDGYYKHLPPTPRLVAQTGASARLHLYGDEAGPDYVDVAPRDGVDDRRGQRLLRLATRFSPILRRNNFSRPVDFRVAMGGQPVLHVDTWRGGRLLHSDSLALDDASELERTDGLLVALLKQLGPDAPSSRIVPPEHGEERVLFFDFPGHDERSWRAAYRHITDSRIYAHFFLHEDTSAMGAERYTLAIQYWLFYPFNDGANNHEGDWEHLVVLVTTPERAQVDGPAAGLMSRADIDRVLAEPDPAFADGLVIRSVEYYFHETVFLLDYLQARRAVPGTRWRELAHVHVWEQPDFFVGAVATRLRALDGRLATHPIGYIGGNNKGPDELTKLVPRFLGSYNRNSHGTYPFPGTWQAVGPVGATEQVAGSIVPRVREDFDLSDPSASLKSAFTDDHFLAYDEADITILPDWERVLPLVRSDPDARREWSWLLLPIRWGFPASHSPGAGLVDHMDLGQVAPEGPAFQSTWNRLAEATGFRIYEPRVVRAILAPMTPWDRLLSGWGILNVPVALLGFVPGWNVAATQLGPWVTGPLEVVGVAPSKTFAPQRRPHRFTSIALGRQYNLAGDAFARLLPAPGDSALSAVEPGTAGYRIADLRAEPVGGPGTRLWLNLHYGPRFTIQNVYTREQSFLRSTLADGASASSSEVNGSLRLQEITGGFRYAVVGLLGDVVQPFAGGGWGWTWYRLDGVQLDGEPVDYERSGGYPVSVLPSARWWPNSTYLAAGAEILSPRERWLFQRVGYGLHAEYAVVFHRLGADRPGGTALGAAIRREVGVGLVLSW